MWSFIQTHPIESGTLIVSIVALVLSIPALRRARRANETSEKANKTAEQNLRHQIINDLFREYRQPEMAKSVRVMWNLNKQGKESPDTVKMAYQFELESEYNEKRLGELDAHRRKVTQFYIQLSVEASYDPIFREVLYSIWFKGDLSIIPFVLLPIDELIIQNKKTMTDVVEMHAQNQRLYRLWENAPQHSKT
jgi:hypothetical protein